MTATELDFESEFLDHSTRASGSGFLKKWKEDGSIEVWICPTAPIYSLWGHSWHRYSEEKDGDTEETVINIRGQRINCLEPETLLKKQTYRNDDDSRELPPTICPMCLCIEWLREQINAGKIEWSTPVFEWSVDTDTPLDGDDDLTKAVFFAGGFTGMFQKKKLSKEELKQLRKCGVKQSEAYKQNGSARQQYVLAVATDAEPDEWVITFEGQTLGNKLKKCIKDEVKRCGGDMEQGHPKYNPYPFEWTYDENKEFSEKYDVVALSRKRPGDRIQKLLDADTMPDFARIIEAPKLGSLKESMKEACCLDDMPIDSFFEKAIDKFGEHFDEETEEGDDDAPEDDDAVETDGEEADEETEEEAAEEETEEEDGDEEEESACDACGTVMGLEDMLCPNDDCGAKYEADDDGNVFLASRKCANEDCMCREVPVNEDGGGTCPVCGAVHAEDWSFKLPKPKAASKKTTAKKTAKKSAAKKAPRKNSDARPSRRAQARAALSKGNG